MPVVSRRSWDPRVPARRRCWTFWRVVVQIGLNVELSEAVWWSTVSAVASIPSFFVNWRSATFLRSLPLCPCSPAGRLSTLLPDWNWGLKDTMKILGITLWVLQSSSLCYFNNVSRESHPHRAHTRSFLFRFFIAMKKHTDNFTRLF